MQVIVNIFADEKDDNGDGVDELRILYRRYDNLFDKYYDEMTSQFIGSDTDFQIAFLEFITENMILEYHFMRWMMNLQIGVNWL